MEFKPTLHTRKEFSSTDDFSATPQCLILAYYNKELGNRSFLTQEANINELKVLVCAFLNPLHSQKIFIMGAAWKIYMLE